MSVVASASASMPIPMAKRTMFSGVRPPTLVAIGQLVRVRRRRLRFPVHPNQCGARGAERDTRDAHFRAPASSASRRGIELARPCPLCGLAATNPACGRNGSSYLSTSLVGRVTVGTRWLGPRSCRGQPAGGMPGRTHIEGRDHPEALMPEPASPDPLVAVAAALTGARV